MLDFWTVATKSKSSRDEDMVHVYPKFIINPRTKDLMIRGGDFYAVWDEKSGMWSQDEKTVIDIVDEELRDYKHKLEATSSRNTTITVAYMYDSDSGSIDRWHKYVQKQMRDKYVPLDEKITFSNTKVKKNDYVSKRLPYPIEEGDFSSYNELMNVLYNPSEREKIEWAVGAIISGDAKKIQKFEVLYGDKGTGKSTVFNIIEKMFDGYCGTFNAKELGSSNNAFALESFKTNPLISIQHDGDLSRIEDNTKLNSVVSHESMELNAKYTKLYSTRFNAFLFMGTNKPVKITEAKSGIIRRLIDVKPSGRKLPYTKYHELVNQINFEFGAIAYHCLDVYKQLGEGYYESYVPTDMISATNDFYDFVDHNYDLFMKNNMVTQNEAWNLYKEYCDFAHAFQMPLRLMKTELRNYFREFYDRKMVDGRNLRNLYFGFISDKFKNLPKSDSEKSDQDDSWLNFDSEVSLFDIDYSDWTAQYAKDDGSPKDYWSRVKTKLQDLDTRRSHYVKVPDGVKLVEIDFDICDENGVKNLDLNREEARKWKATYAELSQSGGGIHLMYFYDGDLDKVSHVFADHIEVKTFPGNAAIRRKLTRCNDIPIATINTGLPLKGEAKLVNWEGIKNEKMLRTMIRRNLNKEYHPDTTSSVDYIKYLLDQAYESGVTYDVSDMRHDVLIFAMNSTNQKDKCVKTVANMKFESEPVEEPEVVSEGYDDDVPIVFFDCEVYSNLFVVVWKYAGASDCVKMINPSPSDVEDLFYFKLIGFNCRQYDNHILKAASLGYSTEQLYDLSQQIINRHTGFFSDAYNISYTDVYDFCTEKMSLKKWEIRLGIHHQEMGIPWDQPAPEDRWEEVAEYCANDVIATEAVFNERQGDFMARKIQVDLVYLLHQAEGINVSVNDTTNTLSKRIIFGRNKSPQSVFNYRNLSKPVGSDQYENYLEKFGADYRFRVFNAQGLPEYRDYIPGEVLPKGWSILPFWPEYEFGYSDKSIYYDEEVTNRVGLGKSMYLGECIGEGGRVYSKKGYYAWVWDGDVNSMHPHSTEQEMLFGPDYTKIYIDIIDARVAIKHRDFESAKKMLNGALVPYLTEELAGDLAQALKIVINSIYGLTKAGFINEFRDTRNEDNIVAKRGALFMSTLKREIERHPGGYEVCHIKTDSIKIPQGDKTIQDFVIKFGREYGYEFETEGVFTKFCLLNDAAYVAYTDDGHWITKAEQFKQEKNPYVYKKLFTHEDIVFDDLCVTKSVSKGALYLDMNEDLDDSTEYEKQLKKAKDPEDIENLKRIIESCHDYHFIGRVGRFCPIIEGKGGGVLYRIDNGKPYAATGTTGYRWLESETVQKYGKYDIISEQYYINLVDEAVHDIQETLDITGEGLVTIDWFLSDEVPEKSPTFDLPYFMNIPENVVDEELPWNE